MEFNTSKKEFEMAVLKRLFDMGYSEKEVEAILLGTVAEVAKEKLEKRKKGNKH